MPPTFLQWAMITYFWIALYKDPGCFPLCQRFRKFRSVFKWYSSFRYLLTGIFGITSGGGPHISVGIFRPKFAVPFLTNGFFALIRECGKTIQNDESHFYWLAGLIGKCHSIFRLLFPLISDQSVWQYGKHPWWSPALITGLLNIFRKLSLGTFSTLLIQAV